MPSEMPRVTLRIEKEYIDKLKLIAEENERLQKCHCISKILLEIFHSEISYTQTYDYLKYNMRNAA